MRKVLAAAFMLTLMLVPLASFAQDTPPAPTLQFSSSVPAGTPDTKGWPAPTDSEVVWRQDPADPKNENNILVRLLVAEGVCSAQGGDCEFRIHVQVAQNKVDEPNRGVLRYVIRRTDGKAGVEGFVLATRNADSESYDLHLFRLRGTVWAEFKETDSDYELEYKFVVITWNIMRSGGYSPQN